MYDPSAQVDEYGNPLPDAGYQSGYYPGYYPRRRRQKRIVITESAAKFLLSAISAGARLAGNRKARGGFRFSRGHRSRY